VEQDNCRAAFMRQHSYPQAWLAVQQRPEALVREPEHAAPYG